MIPFLGFILWTALPFVFGIPIAELLHPWKDEDSLSIRLAYLFLIGLAFEVVMLAVHPWHSDGGLIWQDFVPIILMDIGLFICLKGKITFLKKPRRSDAILLVFAGIMVGAIALHFSNFPIFPEFPSADLRTHVFTTETISYNMPGVQSSLLYGGIHLLLASLLLFQSGDPLILIQEGMGILAVSSLLAVYLSASRLFSEKTALMVSGIYALGGFVWFGFIFNVGLYPNFLALIAGAFLVTALVDSFKGSWASVGLFGIALAFSFFSHYSIITLFPALVAIAAYRLKDSKKRLPNIAVILLMVVPIGVGIALFPALVDALRSTLLGGGSPVLGSGSYTFLASLFSPIPVISFLFEETTSDIIALGIILLAILGVIKSRKNPLTWVMIIWLVTLLLVAPFNDVAWRFSLIALFPLTYLAGSGLTSLMENRSANSLLAGLVQARMTTNNIRKIQAFLAIFLLAFVFTGGWTVHAYITNDQLSDQHQIDGALNWVKANGTGSIITPTDWRFQFSTLYGQSPTTFSCSLVSDPNIAFFGAVHERASYIAVTRQMACSNFPCFQQDVISLSIRNSTLGHSIIINGFEFNKENGTMGIVVDNQTIGSMVITNGNATRVIGFREPGPHQIYLEYGRYVSNIEKIDLGTDSAPVNVPVPLDACLPFYWNSDSLHGATLVWSSRDVRIWCIVTKCTK